VSYRIRVRGLSLLELGTALMLLMVAICIAGSALAQATVHDRMLQRRLAAREAVMIGLERLRAADATALPGAGQSVDFPLPPESARRLPGTTGRLSVSRIDSEPSLVRVRIEIPLPGTREVESGEAVLRLPAAAEVKT
jgi:hypothetical protein